MEKSYSELTKRISSDLRKLRKDIPDTMQAFSALAQAATRDGARLEISSFPIFVISEAPAN
jgi:hypothetical protein